MLRQCRQERLQDIPTTHVARCHTQPAKTAGDLFDEDRPGEDTVNIQQDIDSIREPGSVNGFLATTRHKINKRNSRKIGGIVCIRSENLTLYDFQGRGSGRCQTFYATKNGDDA